MSKTYDEALEVVNSAKEDVKTAKDDLKAYKKKNKVKKGEKIKDAEVSEGVSKREDTLEEARDAATTAKEEAKELKPRKERKTKYEYPDGCDTPEDKKKFRAKMRSDAKKAAKGDAPSKNGKASKKDKKAAKAAKKETAEVED